MPDEPNGAPAQTPADGGAAAQSATASQGQAQPEPDAFATFTARLNKMEALAKELHAERTAHGRTKAAFKLASGDNAEKFLTAYTSFEQEKKSLLEQGYSERVINALAESDPEALRELAQNAPRSTASAKDPLEEIKALRAENEALKAAGKSAPVTPARTNGGGPVTPAGLDQYRQALRSGKPLPSPEEIDRMTAGYLR